MNAMCNIDEQRKQAVKEFAEKLKKRSYCDNDFMDGKWHRYVFVDEGNYYPQHNIYYITGKETRQLRILAAILMSEFVRKQLDNLTNHMNGGYARWQSQYIRKLHIPNIEHIPSELADSLLKCYEDNNASRINYFVSEILLYEKEHSVEKIVKPKPQQLTLSFEYS